MVHCFKPLALLQRGIVQYMQLTSGHRYFHFLCENTASKKAVGDTLIDELGRQEIMHYGL